MTIKNLYPKSRPAIIYNIINGRPELPGQAVFSRASTSTYIDRAGIIRTAAIDEPRFNYDPATGEFLGLLLEEEVTNSLKFTNSYGCFSGDLTMDPLPVNNVQISPDDTQNACQLPEFGANNNISQKNYPNLNGYGLVSFFVKKTGSSPIVRVFIGNSTSSSSGNDILYQDIFNLDTLQAEQGVKYIEYPNGWYRLWKVLKGSSDQGPFVFRFEVSRIENGSTTYEGFDGGSVWGCQLERLGNTNPSRGPSSYIEAQADGVTRNADAFSLTSSNNFDGGFSLLLDSDTTTDDFIYKIKAGGSTIAELTNANGTFDWIINGTSTANSVPPQYPQIGLIQPGRIKTVSSFGAAGDGDQTNYLYTEGLSFPTIAEPAAGADELEFGPGQTLKVLYLWDKQLSNAEAVSVIKGEYNVILNEPIQADAYSFVYNTDPTNAGNASITLPFIVPTVSMRIYWGDTTSTRYEQGVLPQHTYPYPGQYRIQIVADDGFDAVRLGDVTGTIMRVDQWAPQHRVGAAGDGFTGTDLIYMLNNQSYCTFAPPFEYSDLTNIATIFNSCGRLAPNGWDFVPTQLQSCTNTTAAFNYLGGAVGTSAERAVFPQLVTSGALTNINNLFTNAKLSGFVTSSGAPTNRPLTDTSNVISFTGAFSNCDLTDIDLDISSATELSSTFYGNNFVTMPNLGFGNITNLYQTWYSCRSLTGFSSLPDFSSVTNFQSTWYACSSLTSFPLIDTSSGTNFAGTWSGCTSLESFPEIDTSSGTKFNSAWKSVALKSFPSLDFSKATTAKGTWAYCNSLTTFPANMFDTTGTLLSDAFELAWTNCALTKTSIENILVSLDANGASNIELGIDGGANAGQSNWTAAANTAYASLINKGWTITFNA